MPKAKYPKYVQTSIPWLTQIPEHWKIRRGKFVFRTIDERSQTGEELLLSVSEHHGVIPRDQANVNMFQAESYEGYKICSKGDLVINSLWAWSRGLGFSEHRGIVSTAYDVFRLRKDEINFYKYFDFLLRTKGYVGEYLVRSKGIWISRLQLSAWSFLEIPIILPPIEEQTQIAHFLDYKCALIDDAIQKKNRLIELLKEQKQATINRAVTRGLNPNAQMKDSGIEWLGEIPAHWEVKKLKYISKINPGRRSLNQESLAVFLPMEKVGQDGSINQGTKLPIKELATGFTYFEKNDIIIAKITPCFENGKGAYLNNLETEIGFGSTEFHVLRPIKRRVNPEFLNLILVSEKFRSLGEYFMVGSAGQKRVPTSFISNYIIGLPPIPEQKQIVGFIFQESKTIDTTISRIEREIELIKEYKTALIAEAVTGKIDVRDWKPKSKTTNQVENVANL